MRLARAREAHLACVVLHYIIAYGPPKAPQTSLQTLTRSAPKWLARGRV